MSATLFLCLISLLIAGFRSCNGGVGCIGEDGRAVDWWTIAKVPRLEESTNQYYQEGSGYLYFDSNQGRQFLSPDKSIDSEVSAAGYTLSQIYGSSKTVGYAMYNDEQPDGTKDFDHAHSKGTVGFDSTSGFWLVHSVPKYPPSADSSYSYPHSGYMYGQSMLCMSLPLSGINIAGRQFQTNGPTFYSSYIPSSLKASLPDLVKATQSMTIKDPTYHIATLTSMGGMAFLSFAKAKEFNKDLYAMLVAPTLRKPLLVETWIRGKKVCNCSVDCEPKQECNYEVNNVDYVTFTDDAQYKETYDHSKWAVSTDGSVLCIGDINRMSSQFHRGGGTVCFAESRLASLYEAAAEHNTCHECPGHTSLTQFRVEVDISLKHKTMF